MHITQRFYFSWYKQHHLKAREDDSLDWNWQRDVISCKVLSFVCLIPKIMYSYQFRHKCSLVLPQTHLTFIDSPAIALIIIFPPGRFVLCAKIGILNGIGIYKRHKLLIAPSNPILKKCAPSSFFSNTWHANEFVNALQQIQSFLSCFGDVLDIILCSVDIINVSQW